MASCLPQPRDFADQGLHSLGVPSGSCCSAQASFHKLAAASQIIGARAPATASKDSVAECSCSAARAPAQKEIQARAPEIIHCTATVSAAHASPPGQSCKAFGGEKSSTARRQEHQKGAKGRLRQAPRQVEGMESEQQADHSNQLGSVGSSCSRSGSHGYSVDGKNIVRIPPLLLGHIGEAAAGVSEGSLVCPLAASFPCSLLEAF
jgi:hypothetical protein